MLGLRLPLLPQRLRQSLATLRRLDNAAPSSSFARAAFAKLRVQPSPVACTSPAFFPPDVPIEEENLSDYKPQDFYPVHPGDVLHDRYEIKSKLGYGASSTVWLAQDIRRWRWQSNRYVVLKINKCNHLTKEQDEHELSISRHIAQANPSHLGANRVRTIIDSFDAEGPNGTHGCLVYKPMRETLMLRAHRFKNGRIPLPLLKAYMVILLTGLDYLHSQCHIVHLDLKSDNFLLDFESASVLDNYVRRQSEIPTARKIREDGRTIYRSHIDFGPLKGSLGGNPPSIADFGSSKRLDGGYGEHSRQGVPCQVDQYRAPEVLLGTGWSYSADIWNLGVFMWYLMEGGPLFTVQRTKSGKYRYSAEVHLAEMIALLGPPPPEFAKLEHQSQHWEWTPKIPNDKGKLCSTPMDYYGGPFFNFKGEFKQTHLIPKDRTLAKATTTLSGSEKEDFLRFIKKMLHWVPEERKTAKELYEDPWLQDTPCLKQEPGIVVFF